MRTRITLIICLCLFAVGRASAQWAVIDPSNIAQSIVNTSKNVVHTSTTAQNMIKNFQETVKIYEQGKKYYDALKSVNNLVKDARKVQQTILLVALKWIMLMLILGTAALVGWYGAAAIRGLFL